MNIRFEKLIRENVATAILKARAIKRVPASAGLGTVGQALGFPSLGAFLSHLSAGKFRQEKHRVAVARIVADEWKRHCGR